MESVGACLQYNPKQMTANFRRDALKTIMCSRISLDKIWLDFYDRRKIISLYCLIHKALNRFNRKTCKHKRDIYRIHNPYSVGVFINIFNEEIALFAITTFNSLSLKIKLYTLNKIKRRAIILFWTSFEFPVPITCYIHMCFYNYKAYKRYWIIIRCTLHCKIKQFLFFSIVSFRIIITLSTFIYISIFVFYQPVFEEWWRDKI